MGFFMSWLPAFLAHFPRLLSLGPAFQHASWVCWIPDGFPNVRCFLKVPCLDTLLFSLPRTLFFPCGYLRALKLSLDLFSSGKARGVDALVGCSSSPLGLRCSFPQHGGGVVAPAGSQMKPSPGIALGPRGSLVRGHTPPSWGMAHV